MNFNEEAGLWDDDDCDDEEVIIDGPISMDDANNDYANYPDLDDDDLDDDEVDWSPLFG